jgi:hypothetical protein
MVQQMMFSVRVFHEKLCVPENALQLGLSIETPTVYQYEAHVKE